jgi:hypothetical protein
MSRSRETELSILELELEKRKKVCLAYEAKIKKYERANKRVFNAVSQEEIDDLSLSLETQKIEIEILKTKINELKSNT